MSDQKVQITGTKLIRDISNMSLINTDKDELQEYLNKRNYLISQKNEINNLKQEITDLKDDISTIKNLLLQNLNKG